MFGISARTAVLAAMTALVAVAPAAGAATGSVDGTAEERFFVFRTLDSGNEASPEQKRRCREHFGLPRNAVVAAELDARLYATRVDQASARVVDDTYREIGPGFICAVPGAGDQVEGYAYTGLPGIGEVRMAGPCTVRPVAAQPGVAFLNCRLVAIPDPATGVIDGIATSNSIVNPRNAVPGAPTGSLWTGSVIRRPPPDAEVTDAGPGTQPNLVPTSPSQFLVTVGESRPVADVAGTCGPGAVAAREVALGAVQPDLLTALLRPATPLRALGSMTLCLSSPRPDGRSPATATVRVPLNGAPVVLTARGDCAHEPLREDPARALQGCGLLIDADPALGVRGGLGSSNGMVRPATPVETAGQHVWTFVIFAPSPDRTAPPREPAPAASAGPSPAGDGRRPVRLALRGRARPRPGGRALAVRLRCVGGPSARCRGTARASVVVRGPRGRRRMPVALGRFDLAGRRQRTVVLRTTAAGRRLLRRGRAREVILTARAVAPGGRVLRLSRRARIDRRAAAR